MSSKFNMKTKNKPQFMSYTWSSEPKHQKEYVNPHIAEKERIEAIPLEQLSFKDLYKFPFSQSEYNSWVYDANGNFIFQFEFKNEETRQKTIDILNEDLLEYNKHKVESKDGLILVNDHPFILIRGWGNLTGGGAYNLDGKRASKIQDTLAEYIIEKLNV